MSRVPHRLISFLSNPFCLAGLAGLVLILLASLSGVIQNYYSSEEFYIYHYANNLPHVEAWQSFFYQNGRLIEGIYWTYQYKLLGFNPLLEHSLSFVLVLILSILASACFLSVWPQKGRSKALPYLFIALFFTNWVSAMAVFRLSYDNTHLSVIFFFLAGISLQRWAATQLGRWLLLSFSFFLVSVITYENAAFLFPALLLLAWPLLPFRKKEPSRRWALVFMGLAAVSGLILLIPRWLYGFTHRNPGVTLGFSNYLKNAFTAGPTIYSRFGQFLGAPLNPWIASGLLLILVLSVFWIVRTYRGSQPDMTQEARSRWTCIFLASLWLLIFGPLPYVLLGYGAGPRVYSSAVFGIFPLLLMVHENTRKWLLSVVSITLILLFGGLGLFAVKSQSIRFNQGEAAMNIFFRSLKDAVPHVRQNTVFIFILTNQELLGIPGCGPSLEMLYNQKDLKCGYFRSDQTDYECPTIRHKAEIEVDCQHLSGENWILLNVNNNVPTIIEELNPGDYDLFMSWESNEPLRTDYQKIVTRDLPPPSEFYLHLLRRAGVLFR